MQFDITVDEAITVTATRDKIEVGLGDGAGNYRGARAALVQKMFQPQTP
jgi:hypothetical protein